MTYHEALAFVNSLFAANPGEVKFHASEPPDAHKPPVPNSMAMRIDAIARGVSVAALSIAVFRADETDEVQRSVLQEATARVALGLIGALEDKLFDKRSAAAKNN